MNLSVCITNLRVELAKKWYNIKDIIIQRGGNMPEDIPVPPEMIWGANIYTTDTHLVVHQANVSGIYPDSPKTNEPI